MSNKQLIVILSAIAAVVLLYFLPVKSASEVKTDATKEQVLNKKIDEALNIIQTQPMPMPGIKILKEVLEEDPKNVRVLELLSAMSLKTNQYEKAAAYLERLAEVKPTWEVNRQLGDTYIVLQDTAKARSIFEKLYETAPDSTQKESIQRIIKELK
jgi:predicted Zn-dependent protease